MFFHLFERLRQMIVNGDLAYLKRIGNLAVFQSLLEAQAENMLREFCQTRVYVMAEGVEKFLPCAVIPAVFIIALYGRMDTVVITEIASGVLMMLFICFFEYRNAILSWIGRYSMATGIMEASDVKIMKIWLGNRSTRTMQRPVIDPQMAKMASMILGTRSYFAPPIFCPIMEDPAVLTELETSIGTLQI